MSLLILYYVYVMKFISSHTKTKLNSVALVRERTIPTERPPPVGEVTWSVRKVSDRIFLCEHLMDYNLARLHEPTLNLSAHA